MSAIPAQVTVLIAAAGSGTRMGGVSKPLLKINGKYALLYSLEVFLRSPYVERIVISAKNEELLHIRDILSRESYESFHKEILVVEGGRTRQESVKLAFKAAFDKRPQTQLVAIHDAARPMITDEQFDGVIRCAKKYGNAVCAAKAKDTFKRGNRDELITDSVDREDLWHIQTPQVFDTDLFHTSPALAEKTGLSETDESGLVTAAGFLVKLYDCGHENIKITYPEDVCIAEAILGKRKLLKGENS